MTIQAISTQVKNLLNNDAEQIRLMYTTAIYEDTTEAHYTLSGLIEDVIEGLETEGHKDNDYSEYKTVNSSIVENVYHQVK